MLSNVSQRVTILLFLVCICATQNFAMAADTEKEALVKKAANLIASGKTAAGINIIIKEAQKGDLEANFVLGEIYSRGTKYMRRDNDKAVYWYINAWQRAAVSSNNQMMDNAASRIESIAMAKGLRIQKKEIELMLGLGTMAKMFPGLANTRTHFLHCTGVYCVEM